MVPWLGGKDKFMTAEPCGDAEKLCDFDPIVQDPVATDVLRDSA
jgi:hypothetical protein